MIFTIGELLALKGNLHKLSQIKDIPALTGYKIATLVRKLSVPISDAYKVKDDLIRKYAGNPDKDDQVTVLPENMSLFLKELNELVSEEIDVDIREIKLPDDVKLPDATTLVGLDRFITV